MKVKNKKIYILISLVFLVICSAALTSFPVDIFLDRLNYIAYVNNSNILILSNFSKGLLSFFANEPVWLLLNSLLNLLLPNNAVLSLNLILSCSFSLFIYYLFVPRDNLSFSSYCKYFILCLLILTFPLVLKNYVIHIRQGLGVSFFFIGFLSRNKMIKHFFIFLSPLIHSSFFVICFFYYFCIFLKSVKLHPYYKVVIVFLVTIFATFGVSLIAKLAGARQFARMEDVEQGGFSIGLMLWLPFLLIFLLQKKDLLNRLLFPISSIMLYMISFLFVPYAARFLESAVVIIFYSFFSLPLRYRVLSFLILFVFSMALWLSRVNKPLLGFGF